MGDRLEIADVESGDRRIVDVPATTVHLVLTADGGLELDTVGTGALVRLVPTRNGYRLEPSAPGGHVVVNGEELFCKDLRAGDAFVLGGHRLRWLGSPGPATGGAGAAEARARTGSRRPAPAGGEATAARAGRRGASRSRRSAVPVATAVAIALGVAALTLRACARADWPRTPQHYVDLARTQFAGGRGNEALATLDFALRDATGATRVAAEALRREVEQALVAAADVVVLQTAREDLERLEAFRDRFLATDRSRPPARELVRQCDAFLQQHGAALQRAEGGAPLLQQARALRDAHATLADLASPDVAADVVFAARAGLRFQTREYKAAVARLDAFLLQNPGAAEVDRERTAILAEGATWLAERLRQVDGLLARGDRDGARAMFRALERHALLPEWEPMAAPTRSRLQ